jgi:multicomponent Na+:H+ antiporter subunit D
MMMAPEVVAQFVIAVPLVGAVLIWMLRNNPNQREAATLVTAGTLFVLVVSLFPVVADGGRPAAVLVETLPGLPIGIEVEPLGLLFALIASFLWIVTSIYSIGYMRGHKEKNQTRFYVYFAVALSSAMGVAFAADMFTLFVFYEVLTLSTYPLVTHAGTEEAKRGGRVYLGVLLGTSMGFLLLAVIWTWSLAGTLDFRQGGVLTGTASPAVIGVLFALYVFGIGKAAVMPFHRWLPAAMVAPTPVSALLHAVAVVKAGVFSVLKVSVYLFGIDLLGETGASEWLVYVAGATILIASAVAMTQDNLKRRLAYSTVSQLSYVVLAAMLANTASVVGGAMHLAMHAFGKITLFFCAGAIMLVAHKTEVSQLAGIGRRMPWTMAAFTVGALSMVGVPPTAGFASKWYIVLGALEAEQMFAVFVIVISTLLNAGYFLPIVYMAFFRAPQGSPDGTGEVAHGEAPLTVVLALTTTAIGTLLLFFFPMLPLTLANQLLGGNG